MSNKRGYSFILLYLGGVVVECPPGAQEVTGRFPVWVIPKTLKMVVIDFSPSYSGLWD